MPEGTIFEGRALIYKGADVKNQNTGKIGIVCIGDYDASVVNWFAGRPYAGDPVLPQMLDSVRKLTDDAFYGYAETGIGSQDARQARGPLGPLLKTVRNILAAFAVLLLTARVFTGIVYEHDDPTTYLVAKHTPSLAITQENAAETPIRSRFTIIDGDENELAYQQAYESLMRAAPPLAALCAVLAYLCHRRRRAA